MDKFKNNEVNDIYPDNNNYDPLHSSESDSDISIDSNSDDGDIDNNRECGTALYSYGTHTHLGTEDFKFNKDFLKIILKSFIVASLAVLLYFLI
jgi:hypothetical protein